MITKDLSVKDIEVGDIRYWNISSDLFTIIKIDDYKIYYQYIQFPVRKTNQFEVFKSYAIEHTSLISTLFRGEI